MKKRQKAFLKHSYIYSSIPTINRGDIASYPHDKSYVASYFHDEGTRRQTNHTLRHVPPRSCHLPAKP